MRVLGVVQRHAKAVPLDHVRPADRDAPRERMRERGHEQQRRRPARVSRVADGQVLLEQVRAQCGVAAEPEPRPAERGDGRLRPVADDLARTLGGKRARVRQQVQRRTTARAARNEVRVPVQENRHVGDRLRPRWIVVEDDERARLVVHWWTV